MIKRLGIKNFKSLKDISLECKRVNIFIGEPNTGKSNILEALGLLSWCAYGIEENNESGKSVEYRDTWSDTTPATPFQFELFDDFRKKKEISNLHEFIRYKNLENIFFDGNTAKPIRICINDESSLEVNASINDNQFLIKTREKLTNKTKLISNTDLFGKAIKKGVRQKNLDFIKFYRFINLVTFPSPISNSLLPPNGRNLFSVVAKNKKLQQEMSDLFSVVPFEFILNTTEKQFEFHKKIGNIVKSYPYIIASDTLRHIAFFMIAIESNQKTTIILEEPEVHAFPYYVKWLAERIAVYSENQYFIATHNPYLLSAVIEKTRIDNLAINITYLEENQTKIIQLDESQISEITEIDPFFNADYFLPPKGAKE